MTNRRLHLLAENKGIKRAESWKNHILERTPKCFQRSIHFDSVFDEDKVEAFLKDGILTVVVPMARYHEGKKMD